MAPPKPCDQERLRLAVASPGREHRQRAPLLPAEHHRSGNSARSGVGSPGPRKLATADDTATMGTRRCIYAPPQLRQCKPPRRFLLKRCVAKLSLGNVTAAHSPKDLGAVRVLFKRSFVEALDRDIEV